jgi:hypothetical protein
MVIAMPNKWESVDESTFLVYRDERYAPQGVLLNGRPLDDERLAELRPFDGEDA